jgi:hypothetical protein
MCGRFVLMTVGSDLAEHFHLAEEPLFEPRYNIAPTQMVAIVRSDQDPTRRELKPVKWGLIPFWSKDPKIALRLINAPAKSVAEYPYSVRHSRAVAVSYRQTASMNGRKQGARRNHLYSGSLMVSPLHLQEYGSAGGRLKEKSSRAER